MMSRITNCSVDECSYNTNQTCHARAITVGDGVHARCDTFFKNSLFGGTKDQIGSVGACKVPSCRYNENLECQAEAVQVGYHMDQPDCMTFTKR